MKEHSLFIENDLPRKLSISEFNYYYDLYKNGSLPARNIIIESNIGLVISEVNRKFMNNRYAKDDLVSIGFIGLINALDKYNINKSIAFSTYAVTCIDNEIRAYIRKENKSIASLSLETTCKQDDQVSLKDTLVDKNNDMVSSYEDKEERMLVRRAVDKLTPRENDVIKMYYGIDYSRKFTQEEISKKYNVSRTYIYMIIKSSLNKLRNYLLDSNLYQKRPQKKYKINVKWY